ncbi:MAG: PstS family phosphate ABC transporter substrate-binding protein, partial [Dolichospermum sp.]
MKKTAKKLVLALGMLILTTSCTTTSNSADNIQPDSTTEGVIKVDGSSTVYPITQAVVKAYQANSENNSQVKVSISGTSGGLEKFCQGKIDINNASRPINQSEMADCKKNGISYMELPIAFDALTIAVNPQNTWTKDITIAELKKIWDPSAEGKITKWNQIRPSWPDRPIKLYGAGDKSGTFDYFTAAIVGKAKASRKDYTASEDDQVLVTGINKDINALGYFGYAYYAENKDKLKVVAVNSGKGAILPSPETVEKAKYQPRSRPLFIYVNLWSSKNKTVVYKFADFYIKNAAKIANSVGYVPLSEEA